MANQELNTRNNPFVNLGTHIWGNNRFVGRKKEVALLREDCTTRNFCILGLTKMGKTSLAWHAIMYGRDGIRQRLKEEGKWFCPIFFDMALAETSRDLFQSLVDKTYDELEMLGLPEDEWRRVDRAYQKVVGRNYSSLTIQTFFTQKLTEVSVSVVFIMDEFDKVRHYFGGNDYSLLRTILSSPNTHAVVTARRKLIDIERWRQQDNTAGSTFYQIFDGNTIHLGQFSDSDTEDYWSRLQPYYAEIGLPLDDEYKQEAFSKAYRHPHLLDIYNSIRYNAFRQDDYNNADARLRQVMDDAYKGTCQVLEDGNLLDAAIQAVLGPVHDIKQNQLDALVAYEFLRPVSVREKRDLMGVYAGLVTQNDEDEETAYLAQTDYFSLWMQQEYYTKAEFWSEYTRVFHKLRRLCTQFFVDNWGEEWFNNRRIDVIQSVTTLRYRAQQSGVQVGPAEHFVYESVIRTLIVEEYTSAFLSVFGESYDMNRLRYILMIRNYHAHNNADFLSEEDISKANTYLAEVEELLDRWFDSPCPLTYTEELKSEEPVEEVQKPELPFIGIIERDTTYSEPLKVYHIGNVVVSPRFGEVTEGKSARVDDIVDNTNPIVKAKYPFFSGRVEIVDNDQTEA